MASANEHGLSRERSRFSLPRWKMLEQVYAAYIQKMQARSAKSLNASRLALAEASSQGLREGEAFFANVGKVDGASNIIDSDLVLSQKEWRCPQSLPLCISYEARCLLEFYQPLVDSNVLLICDVRVGLEQIPLLIISPQYGLVLLSLCTATVAQLRDDLSIILQHERRGVRWRQDLLASLCKDLKLSLEQSLALQECTCILLCLSSCQVIDIKRHLLPQLRNYSRPQEAARLKALFTDQLSGFRLRYLKHGVYEQVQAKINRTYQNLSSMQMGKKATTTTTSSLSTNGQLSLSLWLALPQGSKRLPPWTQGMAKLEFLPSGVYRGSLSLKSQTKQNADRAIQVEAAACSSVPLFQHLRWPDVSAPNSFLSAAQVQQLQQRMLYLACTFQPLTTTQIVTQSIVAQEEAVNSKTDIALLSSELEQYLRTLNGFQMRAILSPQPFILLGGVYGSGRTVVLVVRALYAYIQWCLNGGISSGKQYAKTASELKVQPCVLLLYAHDMQGQRLKNCLARQVQALALPREAFVLQKLGPYMQKLMALSASAAVGVDAKAVDAMASFESVATDMAGRGTGAVNEFLPRYPVLEIDDVQELSCAELQALYDYHQPQFCLLVGDFCQEHWRKREYLKILKIEVLAQGHDSEQKETWASMADYVNLGQSLRVDMERRRLKGERMLNLAPLSAVPLLTASEKMLLRDVMLPVATASDYGAKMDVSRISAEESETAQVLRQSELADVKAAGKIGSDTDWIQILPLTYRGAPLLTSLVFKFQLQFFTREQIGFDLRTLCDNLTVLEDLKDEEIDAGAGAATTTHSAMTSSSLSISDGSETSLRLWVQQWTQRAQYVPKSMIDAVPIGALLASENGQGDAPLSVISILESYIAEALSQNQSKATATAANVSMGSRANAVVSNTLSLEHLPLDPCGHLSWLQLPSNKSRVELWEQLCFEAESFNQGLAPLYVLMQSERASPSFLPTVQADWAILSNEPQTLQVIDFILRHTKRMYTTQLALPSLEEVLIYALNSKQQELISSNVNANYQRLLALIHAQLKRELAWHDTSALAMQLHSTWGKSTKGQTYLHLWLQGLELNSLSRKASVGCEDGNDQAVAGVKVGANSASSKQSISPALQLWMQQLQILLHKLNLALAPCASVSFNRLSQQFIAFVGVLDPRNEAMAKGGDLIVSKGGTILPDAWQVLLWVLALPDSIVLAQASDSAKSKDASKEVEVISQSLQRWRLRLIAPSLSSRLSKLLCMALLRSYLPQHASLLERMIEAYVGQDPVLVKRVVALLSHLSHMFIGSLKQWQVLLFNLMHQRRQSEYASASIEILPDLAIHSEMEMHTEWTRHTVSISTIEAFQGLESERVLLLLLPDGLNDSQEKNVALRDDDVSPKLLYSAITRVRSYLRVLHQIPLLTQQLEPLLQQVHDDMMALRDDSQSEAEAEPVEQDADQVISSQAVVSNPVEEKVHESEITYASKNMVMVGIGKIF